MKSFKKLQILLLITIMFVFSSCRLWEKVFPPKYGCPTNGKNVGAEGLLQENKDGKKSSRAAKKARKFKA